MARAELREDVPMKAVSRNTLADRVEALEEKISMLFKFKEEHADHLSGHDDDISQVMREVGL